jgi:hypothetical protein
MQISSPGANATCDGFVDTLDSGFVWFHTAAHGEVAKCPMNATAFGAAAAGVATMNTGTAVEDTTTTAGTIDHAHLAKSDNTLMSLMTCGVGSGEVQFSSLTFGNNETLRVTSLTVAWTVTAIS